MDILKIPKEDWDDTGFENLAIAVVQQACEDYKKPIWANLSTIGLRNG